MSGRKLYLIFLFASIPVIFFFLFSKHMLLWDVLNIPWDYPHFLDASIFGIASESHALGFDPLYLNPQHPLGQRLNYPRIWHLLFALNIDRSHTYIIGSIFVILFYIGLVVFVHRTNFDYLTAILLAIVTFSPVVMLGIERGNNDLVVFFLVALAVSLSYLSRFAGFFLLMFASALNLFPIFGLFYLLKEKKRKFWSLFLSGLGLFIIYGLYTFNDLNQVYITTTQNAKVHYGINVYWMALTHPRIFNLHLQDDVIMTARIFTYMIITVILIVTLLLGIKKSASVKSRHMQNLDFFRVGAIIYVGTFLLGANADYRLMFLIFTIPQLVSWIYIKGERNYSLVPLITLSAIIISCWNYVEKKFLLGMKIGFVLEETANCIILSGLLYLFLVSVPDWFGDFLRKPFSKIKFLGIQGLKR